MLKPGKLTSEEFEVIKTHTTIGYKILANPSSKYLKAGAVIAISHHEKYDGTGYPKGLRGDGIPIFGRIVSIADVFDALSTKRPYKGARQFRYLSRFLPLNHEIIKSTAKHRASQSNNRISPINCPVHTGLLYSGTNNMPAS